MPAIATDDPITPAATSSAANDFAAQGYTVVPATFTGEFGPNGETMTLNGTIEEVMAQVADINPNYKWAGEDGSVTSQGDPEDDAWRERKVAKKDCNTDAGKAVKSTILAGVQYLYKKPKDQARLEVKTCSRISCSYNAAIYMCWDPVEGAPAVYTQPWWYVADYAKGIALEWCPHEFDRDIGTYMVGGKTWDPMGLAVHVRRDKC